MFGYDNVKVSLTKNLSVKKHLEQILKAKSIIIENTQRYQNHFEIFRITFYSPKSESKHALTPLNWG
jgi:hypothetical protein